MEPENDSIEITAPEPVELCDINDALPALQETIATLMPCLALDRTKPTQTAADGFVDYNNLTIPADENELDENPFDKYLMFIKPRLEAVLAMRRRGLNNREVAHNLGVSESFLAECVRTKPELFRVMGLGKLDHVSILENALAMRATGYTVMLKKQKVLRDGSIVDIDDTVYIPPDPQSLIFTLNNLAPDKWKTKTDTTISGSIDHQFKTIFATIAEKEAAERAKELEPPE